MRYRSPSDAINSLDAYDVPVGLDHRAGKGYRNGAFRLRLLVSKVDKETNESDSKALERYSTKTPVYEKSVFPLVRLSSESAMSLSEERRSRIEMKR